MRRHVATPAVNSCSISPHSVRACVALLAIIICKARSHSHAVGQTLLCCVRVFVSLCMNTQASSLNTTMALSKIPFGAGVAALVAANAGVVYWWFMQGPAAHEPLPPVLQWLDPHRQPAIDQSSAVELSPGVSAAAQAFASLARAARSDSSVAPSVPTAAVAAVLQQASHERGATMSASDATEAAAALDVFDSGRVSLLVLAAVATLLQETRPSNAGAGMWQVFETAGIVQPALGMDRQTWWQFVMQLPANAMEVHAATGVLFPPDADTEYVNRTRALQLRMCLTLTHAHTRARALGACIAILSEYIATRLDFKQRWLAWQMLQDAIALPGPAKQFFSNRRACDAMLLGLTDAVSGAILPRAAGPTGHAER